MELIIMRTSLGALEIPKGLSKVEVAGGGGGGGRRNFWSCGQTVS